MPTKPTALDRSHVGGHSFPCALKVERMDDLGIAFGADREPRQFRATVALKWSGSRRIARAAVE
jgi:hypothetical protein